MYAYVSAGRSRAFSAVDQVLHARSSGAVAVVLDLDHADDVRVQPESASTDLVRLAARTRRCSGAAALGHAAADAERARTVVRR